MPGRTAKNAPKRTGPAATAAVVGSPGGLAPAAASDQVARLEAECQRLSAELDAARARIEEMEQARKQALDRIAWTIDSLHNLLDE